MIESQSKKGRILCGKKKSLQKETLRRKQVLMAQMTIVNHRSKTCAMCYKKEVLGTSLKYTLPKRRHNEQQLGELSQKYWSSRNTIEVLFTSYNHKRMSNCYKHLRKQKQEPLSDDAYTGAMEDT